MLPAPPNNARPPITFSQKPFTRNTYSQPSKNIRAPTKQEMDEKKEEWTLYMVWSQVC